MNSPKRDFLTLSDFTLAEHELLLTQTAKLKASWKKREVNSSLAGRTLVCLFEKSSTRTRLSFEAAMSQLGGHAITLPFSDSQLARGEPLSDTARVASSYSDAIMFRTFGDDRLRECARASSVPVINGLSDGGHPVQILADLFTVQEKLGGIGGKRIAWIGDAASNMALSWCEAARIFGFELRISAPPGYRPADDVVKRAEGRVTLVDAPVDAVRGADVVSTDVFTSMGQEKESAARKVAFADYQVDDALMAKASPHAIFLHCLPAHRGEEVSASVLEGRQSAVWDEAENRLHVQKALLQKLILG